MRKRIFYLFFTIYSCCLFRAWWTGRCPRLRCKKRCRVCAAGICLLFLQCCYLLFAQDQEGTQVSKMANEVRVLGLWRVILISAGNARVDHRNHSGQQENVVHCGGLARRNGTRGLLWREERRNVQSQNQMLRTVTWLFILVLFLFFSYYNTTTTTTRWCRRGWPKRPLLRLGLLWSIHKYILGIFWRGGSPGQILLLPTVYISIDYVQQQQLMDVVLGASREAEKETQPWI